MRVWVTRARPGGQDTAGRLMRLGHEPLLAPLMEIRDLPADIVLDDAGALAFTSLHGVMAFARRCPARDLPVFAVGDATARAARAVGFARTDSAAGDGEALAALIIARRDAIHGTVVHPGAQRLAGDLAGALTAAGVPARALAIYEAVPVPPAPRTLSALPGLDAVLVHSPQAGRLLARVEGARTLHICCISKAAAAPLEAENFSRVSTAPFPNEAALLKLLDDRPEEGAP